MEQPQADPCAFRMARERKVELIMAVHVDYLVVAGTTATCAHMQR